MQYIVVKDFSDIQDDRHVYHAGDTFPRMGLEVSAERVAELASDNNKRGEILIKAVRVAQEPEIQPVSDETEVFDEIIDKEKKPPKKRNKKEK